LFAYCNSNPVNNNDKQGTWPRCITKAIARVATIAAAVSSVVSKPISRALKCVATTAKVAYAAQSYHYDDRKSRNTNLPKTRDEAKESGWYGPDTNPKGPLAACHQYSSPDRSNVKYVSPDGHREAIYNSAGNLVLDSRDVGTYNYSPSGTIKGSIGHFFVDMIPWYIFGNDDDDPGPLANEMIRLFS